jgi:hypothetical protein
MEKGACLCGAVAYEIDGGISPIWLCHCSKCRRQTGSAFHAAAACSRDSFRWISGEDVISEYEDTPGYTVHFCSRCGSGVPSYLEEHGIMLLKAGGLEGDPGREVDHHIFVGSKAPWYEITDGKPEHEKHRT